MIHVIMHNIWLIFLVFNTLILNNVIINRNKQTKISIVLELYWFSPVIEYQNTNLIIFNLFKNTDENFISIRIMKWRFEKCAFRGVFFLLMIKTVDQRVSHCHYIFVMLVTTHRKWNNILTSGDIWRSLT